MCFKVDTTEMFVLLLIYTLPVVIFSISNLNSPNLSLSLNQMPQLSGEHTELLKNQFDENACIVSEIKKFHTLTP